MRLERLMDFMKKRQLEAVIIADGCNMEYFSGFSGATGYLYISEKVKKILTDSRYTTQAKMESKDFDIYEVNSGRNYVDAIHKMMQEDNIKSIGFEDTYLKYSEVVKFMQSGENQKWVPLADELSNLRSIKDEQEIQKLKMAESIGDKSFTRILDILRPGMTEIEVAAELEYGMKMNGAQGFSFDSIVASGPNSALPHATPSARKLETGDFVTMDFGCIYQGYCSDMTRTVVIGKASDKQREIYQIVLDAQLSALEFIKAGRTGKEVDQVARDIIEKAGYGAYFGHGLGHSVGLEIHEEPRLSPTCSVELKVNVIETVEPGIYIPEFGGVRIEDMVLVTEEGCINFTNSPKELLEI
jgi:Xaa-Pro aminopeptidase